MLARVHSECLTGDVFGSARCDCGTQLDDALATVAREDRGVVVYLRGHEGRGIGIAHKLRAYNLQDQGWDTVDANLQLGLPVDSREYGIGAQMLVDVGVQRIRLMTNNPAKYRGLSGYGLEIVERVPIAPRVTVENVAYLRTKRQRMGHLLPGRDGGPGVATYGHRHRPRDLPPRPRPPADGRHRRAHLPHLRAARRGPVLARLARPPRRSGPGGRSLIRSTDEGEHS